MNSVPTVTTTQHRRLDATAHDHGATQPSDAVITDQDHRTLLPALRAYAAGIYPTEAGIELLIHHKVFLHRDDFTSRFIEHATTHTDGTDLATIHWHAAINALNNDLPCSSAEQRILRLAASLADDIPISLRDTLTGLDDKGIQLVITAVLHASGRRPSPTHS